MRMPSRRGWVLSSRTVSGSALLGILSLGLLVGIAWRATSAGWFLLFPLLLLGMLAAAAISVLWGIRHL